MMTNTQHWSYDLLKSYISTRNTGPDEVEYFKNLFKDEIQSERRYACITSVTELLDCLERQDVLSEYNIDPLQTISESYTDDGELATALDRYRPPERPKEPVNEYSLQRIQERHSYKIIKETPPVLPQQTPVVVIEFSQEKRDNIYKIIARDIGRNWRSLGRELLVRSGDLDKIEVKHPSDLQSRVYEILEIFENDPRHNPREHYIIICDALDNCKRKDIRRYVQKIMCY